MRISRFQICFHYYRFHHFSNEKVEIKFKTCFANADEISMISINLVNFTISQITIQKEEKDWRCFHFARIANNHQTCKNEKQSEWSWNFIHCLFSWLQKRKDCQIINFIFILHQTTFFHSHSFNIIKSNQSKLRWEEEKKINIINNHWTNLIPHCLTRAWRED